MNLFDVYDAVWDKANNFAENTSQYYQDYAFNVWGVSLTDRQADILISTRKCWEYVKDKDANQHFHLVEKDLRSVEIGNAE